MGQNSALYRKYRGKDLSEIIGQKHITDTLSNAIKNGQISHAYLFTGPHGVGKTSVARILAHEINGLDYTEDTQHLDIIEIDAASNRRIDEIRDLRDKVQILPTSADYKVYIIDEVHMLTKEAFNALLKTLEEPPKHVVFILATTEAHKLPSTIISRTQRHTFKPIKEVDAVKHLRHIADTESINIDDQALKLVAKHGNGSFRDSISILDQVQSHGSKIDKSAIEQLLGQASHESISQLTYAFKNEDAKSIVDSLDQLKESGVTASALADQISAILRQEYLENPDEIDLHAVDELLAVQSSRHPWLKLELVLLNTNASHKSTKQAPSSQPVTSMAPKISAPAPQKAPKAAPVDARGATKDQSVTKATEGQKLGANTWASILSDVKQKNNSLYAVLRMASASQDGDKVILNFKFPFHQKRASDKTNQSLIQKAVTDELGKNVSIEMVSKKPKQPEQKVVTETVPSKKDPMQRVMDTFGGGEVVEL